MSSPTAPSSSDVDGRLPGARSGSGRLSEVVLPDAGRKAILAAAAAAGARECCGLLVGRVQCGQALVREVVPAPNVAEDPARFFEIDPRVLLATHRRVREEGEVLLGWYHSHPSGDIRPSAHDAARAIETGKVWLVAAGGAIGAYVAEEEGAIAGRFRPLPLRVISGANEQGGQPWLPVK